MKKYIKAIVYPSEKPIMPYTDYCVDGITADGASVAISIHTPYEDAIHTACEVAPLVQLVKSVEE